MFYKFVYYFIAPVIVMPYLRLFNRIEAVGFDRIPAEGAVVMIANHISMWDPVIMFCLIRRRVNFMAKSELFSIPVLGTMLRLVCVFPVKRDSVDRTALRKASQVLEEGSILVVFPEGQRSRTGELMPFKQGAALFAHRAEAPVIPVMFENTPKIFPMSIRKKVRIVCGSPLDLSEFAGKKADSALLERMTGKFRQSIEGLQAEAVGA